jgi:beta-N-acetylhexosaminidase
MDEMVEVAGTTGAMTRDAVRRFEAGRSYLARHRRPQALADTAKRLTELLPEWG